MIPQQPRHRLFILVSLASIAVFFAVAAVLEATVFPSAPKYLSHFLYAVRGAGAAFLVMGLAIFFLVGQHRSSETDLRKLFRAVEYSPASIMVTDREGTIEYVNPRFTHLTGYSLPEVLGKNPRILKSGLTPPDRYRDLWRTVVSGKTWTGEFRNRKKNGEIYDEYLSVSPIQDDKGEITHFVGVLEDITERKDMDRLKDALVGTVSHEIRTPIAIIRWSVEGLAEDLSKSLSKEQNATLDGILRNCDRLTKIANEILDFTRLGAEDTAIDRERTSLRPIVEEIRKSYAKRLADQGILFETNLPEDLPDVDADPDRIFQVFRNLVDNSMRYARSRICVTVTPFEGSVHVVVEDDGRGIPSEDLSRIFYRYHRIQTKQKPGEAVGAGLGLAICREVVERHGGRIWAESDLEKGTEIHFTLPVWRKPSEDKEALWHARQS